MKKIHLFNPRSILFAILTALLAVALFETPQLIQAGPLPALDDANTVVLLHMDGADGSTLFNDESGKVWVAIDDPQISDSTGRFDQSIELDSGDAILTPDTNDVYFGRGDFTIDFWISFAAPIAAGNTVPLFSQQQDNNNFMEFTRTSTTWNFTVESAGTSIISLSTSGLDEMGVWNHIALVRSGDTFRIFENGTQIGMATDPDGLPDFAAPLYISSATSTLSGNLDEFRISRTARWTSDFVPLAAPYEAPTPTATSTPTYTFTPSITPTGTPPTSMPATSTPIPRSLIVITVPAVITIQDANTNTNETNPGGGAGSFSAVTPIPWTGQGGVAVLGGMSCGGYYIRTRVYVDDNQDKMMSPAEGITGLQVFFLDQTYARLGTVYTTDGKAEFCIPVTHYGKSLLIDIPYLQLFGTVQIPDQPNQDLEIWFPGETPTLPLFLP